MSSPVANLMLRAQHSMSKGTEGSVFIEDKQRKDILRGIFENYYADYPNVIFDTNRIWTSKLPLLHELFPAAKVICCVRNLGWIMNSFEKLVVDNPMELSGIYSYQTNGNVFTRINYLASGDGLVGYALNNLKEACYGPFRDKLFLIDYDALVLAPGDVFRNLYEFINQPFYQHDFENFSYEASNFDEAIGTPGLHKVKGPIEWKDQKLIIPQNLFNSFQGDAFWHQDIGCKSIIWQHKTQ